MEEENHVGGDSNGVVEASALQHVPRAVRFYNSSIPGGAGKLLVQPLPIPPGVTLSRNVPDTPPEAEVREAPVQVDRSSWMATAFKKNPEILALRERLRTVPFPPQHTMAEHPPLARTEVKESLGHPNVMRMIMEYLESRGLKSAVTAIEEESKVKYIPDDPLAKDALVALLRIAIKDTNKVFDPIKTKEEEEDVHFAAEDDEEVEQTDRVAYQLSSDTEDDNIWEELCLYIGVDQKTKKDVDGKLTYASLNRTVEAFVLPESTEFTGVELDTDYQRMISTCFETFATGQEVIKKIIDMFEVPEFQAGEEYPIDADHIKKCACKCLNTFINSLENISENIRQDITHFIDKKLSRDGFQGLGRAIKATMERKIEGKSNTKNFSAEFETPPPEAKVPWKTIFSPTLDLFDCPSEEIARQISLTDFKIFSKIKPSELLGTGWLRPEERRSANVVAMISRFNNLRMWVIETVITPTDMAKRRRNFHKFVKICENLRMLNNMNSLAAVVSGLGSDAVSQLKSTKAGLETRITAMFGDLTKLLSDDNRKSFMTIMRDLANAGSPCIPVLDFYLQTLVKIEAEYPTRDEELINIAKVKELYVIITELLRFGKHPYNFIPVAQISVLLKKINEMEEKGSYAAQQDAFLRTATAHEPSTEHPKEKRESRFGGSGSTETTNKNVPLTSLSEFGF